MAFKRENINKNYYTTGEVVDLFQVSTKTIQKWDNKVLEELLGETKVAEVFMQRYIKLIGDKLQISEDLKGVDLFNIE